MKIWMVVAVLGVLAVAGFAVAGVLDSDVAEEVRPCGKVACDGAGCDGQ